MTCSIVPIHAAAGALISRTTKPWSSSEASPLERGVPTRRYGFGRSSNPWPRRDDAPRWTHQVEVDRWQCMKSSANSPAFR
jgi:hypothetical protein